MLRDVSKLLCAALTGAVALLALGPAAFAAEEVTGDPFTLDVCVVSGEKLGSMGDPIIISHEGREIRFCCAGCPPKFESDPATFLSKIDEMMIKQQQSVYPLETCVVSGEVLTSSAKEVIINNRLVKFCSPDCPDTFAKDAAMYMAKLDDAVIEKQMATYPFDKCIVSAEKLEEGRTTKIVIANRLMKFCCTMCIDEVRNDPLAALTQLMTGKFTAEGSDSK